jgi:hypothetical protein
MAVAWFSYFSDFHRLIESIMQFYGRLCLTELVKFFTMSNALGMLAFSDVRTNGMVRGKTCQDRHNALYFGFCAMALGNKKITHPIYEECWQDSICLPVMASAGLLHILFVVALHFYLHCGAYENA